MPPVKSALLTLLLATAALVPGGRADDETMAQHTLRGILDRQKALMAETAQGDEKLDKETLRLQLQQLVHEYELLIKANPDYADAYADYGYLLWKLDLPHEAMQQLLKADRLDPNIPMVKNELGNALAEDGKTIEALNYFKAAADLNPKEPLYHYQIGTLLYAAREDFIGRGGYTRAQWDEEMHGEFRKAAELAPDQIAFTYRYAESFADLTAPPWDEAYAYWGSLLPKASGAVGRDTILLQQANIRLKQGRVDDAKSLVDQVKAPELEKQKQKLVAQFPETQKK